jgi:hypothetical protein
MLVPGDPALPSAPPSAPQPINPMTFGQALDRVFRIMKANLRLFLSIGTIPAASMAVIVGLMFAALFSVVNPWHRLDPQTLPPHLGLFFFVVLIGEVWILLVYALYEPATSYAALQADAGITISTGEAYRVAWEKAGRYLWLMILRSLIVSGPILVFVMIIFCGVALTAFPAKSHMDSGAAILFFPFFMLLYAGAAIYMVLAMIWMAFSYPACVQENLTATEAIARSVRLTRGARGRIFLLGAVIYAITYAIFLVVECVFGVVGALAMFVGMALHLHMVPWGLVGIGIAATCLLIAIFFGAACSVAAYSTASAVLYRNQRLCREGILPASAAPEVEGLAL